MSALRLKRESLLVKYLNATIPAGFPSPASDYEEEEIDIVKVFGLNKPSVFYIKVVGASMENSHIPDGAIIAVDKAKKGTNNSIIVGALNGEFTVKRLVKSYAGWVLHPENPAFKPYLIREEDVFEVWGVVIRVFLDPEKY
jgi:DNA polymerase V